MCPAEQIDFRDGDCRICNIVETERLNEAYRLRHRVYCEALKWVPPSVEGLEIDRYDPGSVSLGVYGNEGALLGLARIITSDQPFMLEYEFRSLLPSGYEIRKDRDTAEITRLTTLLPSSHLQVESRQVSKLIYKGIYQWCEAHGVRYLYFVVMPRFLRALRLMGFPCSAIGPVATLGGQTECVAALLDWEEFEEHAGRLAPTFLQWIATTGPNSAAGLGQPYRPGSTHQVSTLPSEHGTLPSVH